MKRLYWMLNKPWVAAPIVRRALRLSKARNELAERELIEFWERLAAMRPPTVVGRIESVTADDASVSMTYTVDPNTLYGPAILAAINGKPIRASLRGGPW